MAFDDNGEQDSGGVKHIHMRASYRGLRNADGTFQGRERSLLQSPDEFPPAASIRKFRRTRPRQAQGSYDNAEHISQCFRPHPTLSAHHSDLDYVATMPAEEAVKAPVLIRHISEAIGYCVPLPHLLRPGFLTHHHSFS